jgi:dTDP-4-amino-4,6-dideoxygalactose transaminase
MIPFVDLKAQVQSIRNEVQSAMGEVLDSAQFVLGAHVTAFEKLFADYCQTQYAVAVNSGTSALHLALLAAGVGKGDEVITVPFTFVATVAAIVYTGATPVFVDINPETYTMDPALIERAITSRTKAILPVHLYGQTAEMEPILQIARKRNLIVIEDAAQAHGAEYNGRRAGSFGRLGCFSFYPGKNLGAYGEGGAVTTDSPELAQKVRILRDWGAEEKYVHAVHGFNYRMEGIQGAVLTVKMRYIEKWTEARRQLAQNYADWLSDSGVTCPVSRPNCRHVYHVYAVRSSRRDQLRKHLESLGVQTGIHYPIPVHLQPAYSTLGYSSGQFPHSERAANEVLSLPMFPELTRNQQIDVANAVKQFQIS